MKKILFLVLGLITHVTVMAQSDIRRDTYVYAIKGDDTLHLDVYIDHSIPIKELRPVMIHVHGGGYSAGSRKNVAQEMFNRHFAEMGFVSVSIDYRLGVREDNKYNVTNTKEIMRLATEDLVSATNFILSKEKEWHIDQSTVLTSGGSAGATTILALEHDICNNVNYTKALPKDFNYAGIISHAGAIIMEGDTLKWDKKPCPMLLFHGDKDFAVPFDVAEAAGFTFVGTSYLHRQFKDMQIPHWAYVEKGADHIMAMKPLTNNNEETDKFYHEFIKGKCKSYVYTEWVDEEPSDMTSVDQMLKYVPLYILGFGKYLEEMMVAPIERPENIVF
ncbi:alpha/beta hydrolase [Bacteroides sp. 519]|uniref:alpha/beta hydrolase n=1 Tax=Bacteroides sp. 519 TaxID=2302937 RepID=UPI0013D8C428|nr:alpha/beta hydrolase [Bacteroides sp. 519]NDV57041.1 alpha/beta hydrolase [Bacteroides sp. 519]